MSFFNRLLDKWEAMRPAKRHLLGTLLTLVMVAAGAPVQLAAIAGQVVGMAAVPVPVVVPPVPVQIGEALPPILQGIVPSAPETSTRDTAGPPAEDLQ